jgi:hypothetical protein
VSQEVELSFRYFADSCLLLVDRELQFSHDLAQSLQSLCGLAPPAQDHEVVGVGHDARAEASLQPELLPSQRDGRNLWSGPTEPVVPPGGLDRRPPFPSERPQSLAAGS